MTKNNGAIAILGGMGPQASAKMLEVMVSMAAREFGAKNCEDFPEIILFSVPFPDFISSKKNARRAKLLLKKKVAFLNNIDVSVVVIACNTAHILIDDLQVVSKAPFVSMIGAVADEVKRQGLKKVGILATPSAIRSKLFQRALSGIGVVTVIPNRDQFMEIESVVRKVISQEVSENDVLRLANVANDLVEKGAEGIILGCTELPLVFPKDFQLPIFDSIEILSRKLLTLQFSKSYTKGAL
ncbi:amino acid racemase [Candidatus Curtissbacteria bacterium]|nr:amino acid racemase [Candidatus Curtissbacteria bacterium]